MQVVRAPKAGPVSRKAVSYAWCTIQTRENFAKKRSWSNQVTKNVILSTFLSLDKPCGTVERSAESSWADPDWKRRITELAIYLFNWTSIGLKL